MINAAWEGLLGLPLEQAQEKARAGGMEPRVLVTRAARRKGEEVAEDRGTLRVIRVRASDAGLELTVSAFQDGEPKSH